MTEPIERIQIRLWRADVVVLFDWLMSVDLNAVPITHPAEKQALVDLLGQLEGAVVGTTQEEIDEARRLVSENMGW